MNPSTAECAAFAAEVARAAGQALMARFGAALDVQAKGGNLRDLVTDADRAAEGVILEALTRRFPDHAVLSEEAGALGPASDYLWLVDPLDGTTNFSRCIPLFAVSLALLEAGRPLLGVVYHPVTGELFHALRDHGAFLGDQRLEGSTQSTLERAAICVEWGKSEASVRHGLRQLVRVARQANKLRALGSAALNLAYVAAGRLDAFVVDGLYPWDVAAGVLLVQEAGGRVTPPVLPVPVPPPQEPGGLLVASNAALHDALLRCLGASPAPR
ncbi:MAG: inositol monophosphatase [Chloroflexi bacterium]|nr:inositol monophosphatase [Chloroflexota bacterium]